MGLLDKMQDYFGSGVSDSRRTANNKKVVDALTIEDHMDTFLRKDALQSHETNRQVHVMFKHIRQGNNAVKTQMELFFDKWCQHHGPIVTQAEVDAAKNAGTPKDKLPVENFSVAIRAAVRYGKHIAKIVAAKQEAVEWRAMQGPLVDGFDDERMKPHPSDADLEAALIKANPDLKQFKK